MKRFLIELAAIPVVLTAALPFIYAIGYALGYR